jgi:hypothetical protein
MGEEMWRRRSTKVAEQVTEAIRADANGFAAAVSAALAGTQLRNDIAELFEHCRDNPGPSTPELVEPDEPA